MLSAAAAVAEVNKPYKEVAFGKELRKDVFNDGVALVAMASLRELVRELSIVAVTSTRGLLCPLLHSVPLSSFFSFSYALHSRSCQADEEVKQLAYFALCFPNVATLKEVVAVCKTLFASPSHQPLQTFMPTPITRTHNRYAEKQDDPSRTTEVQTGVLLVLKRIIECNPARMREDPVSARAVLGFVRSGPQSLRATCGLWALVRAAQQAAMSDAASCTKLAEVLQESVPPSSSSSNNSKGAKELSDSACSEWLQSTLYVSSLDAADVMAKLRRLNLIDVEQDTRTRGRNIFQVC